MLRLTYGRIGSHRRTSFTPTVVLYHAECADGFGAAWALWRRFPSADYRPVKHGIRSRWIARPTGRDRRFQLWSRAAQAMADETQALLVWTIT